MSGKKGSASGGRRPAPRGAGHTVQLDDGSDVRAEMARAMRSRRRPALVVLHGADVGMRCTIDGSSLAIGRDPTGGLVLTDPGTSWAHARIEDRGDNWVVMDLGSTNGTSVNGERITEATLRPNDKVTFGRTVARFELQDALEHAYGETVERLINVDDLSGLYVRRKFDADLAGVLSVAQQSGSPVALLVMDLDGIKQINDTHGHLFGAYVIGESGHLLGRLLDGQGFGTRFGGDEFIAALPGATLDRGEAFAQSMLEAVATHRFEREGVTLHPGISIGVAAFPESASDAPTLFQRADEAMYRAKKGGRNRVCR